jgi:hypothetical protein
MFLRLTVAAMNRWHDLTHPEESDRGDSPVPTVIIWAGIAIVAAALIVWVTTLVQGFENSPANPVAP